MTTADGLRFVPDSIVNPKAIEDFAQSKDITFSYEEVKSYSTSDDFNSNDYLNQRMCSLRPAILKVRYPGAGWHYVDATAIATEDGISTWRLHDPLQSTTRTLLDFYDNIYYQIRAASTELPSSYFTIAAHSPVEMVITDPQGKRVGYDPRTDTTYDEIDQAEYGKEELSEAY